LPSSTFGRCAEVALARTQSVVLEGIRGHVVEVETHLGAGLPNVRHTIPN